MAKILKIRRGTQSTMSGAKKNTVLSSGEVFFEMPNTGTGKGAGKIKVGDGTTTYENLPYFMEATNLETSTVTVTSNSQTTVTAALNDVTSNKTLPVLVGALKNAVSILNTTVTNQFDDSQTGSQASKIAALETYTGINDGNINTLSNRVTSLETSFPAGCNTIMAAVTAKGQTPASNSPSDIATAISNISTGADLLDILLGNVTIDIESTLLKMTKSQFDTYKSQLVGKTVSISNSQQDGAKSMDWVIIDYNHDSTSYTFDLWATRAMFDSVKFGSSQRYQDSGCTARTKIEGAITGFSSELQAKLQTMLISVNSTTVSAKIKLLSLTEMGISSGNYHPGVEGTAYDKYFTTGRSTGNTYADLIRNNSSGSATYYWSRSRYANNSGSVWDVNGGGNVRNNSYTDSFALIPAIRIAVG